MKHDITAVGRGFSLRPITLDDAPFVLELRTDPVRARHLHSTSPDLQDQLAWTERYFERDGDWYFVIEDRATGCPEGLVAIYDVDAARTTGEWGRWILREGSFGALESAVLVLDTAFDTIGLDRTVTRTRADNESVVSFHTSLGAVTTGKAVDDTGDELVEQVMTAASWRARRDVIMRVVAAAADMASRR